MSSLTRRSFGAAALSGAALAMVGGRAAKAAETIRVGVLPLTSHAPTFIADGKDYFSEAGFEAKLVSFQAAQPMAVAIAAGDVDFGVTAITGALVNLSDKGVVKVIGGALEEEPGIEGEKILASDKAFKSGLTNPAQLKGRTFGITTAGSSFAYMAYKIAQKEGFPAGDIHLKPLQRVPVLIAAIKSGEIDAWAIVPNIADALTKGGGVHEIGKISDFIPHYQVTTVFTSTANVDKRPDLVKRFLAAYGKGAADYNAALVDKTMDEKTTEEIIALIHKFVYASEPLAKAAPRIAHGAMRISPKSRLNLGSVQDQLDWFKAQHLVPPQSSIDNLVDARFVETY
ncbi:MAG TPA: ABC transporter substrate-binding protein [Stellaceae bacterium]|nr:ABC transporter substrate-binding protein [Stellaceae bacterium]